MLMMRQGQVRGLSPWQLHGVEPPLQLETFIVFQSMSLDPTDEIVF